jgi:hypothetical protein
VEQFLNNNFKLLLIICLANMVLTAVAAICYRAWKGKKRAAIQPFDLTFSEKWVSGVSSKNMLSKLGGASNCLIVELSRSALSIRPMFPFNLMFFSEVYDLEHFIQKDKIKSVQTGAEQGGKGKILIDFEASGKEKRIELVLRKRQEFLHAFGPVIVAQPVPSGILT